MKAKRGEASVEMRLRSLCLPAFAANYAELAARAAKDGTSHVEYLGGLAELELRERAQRRVTRLRKASGLPSEKTAATLERGRLPAAARTSFAALKDGAFLETATNVLVFGNSGSGKTHVVAALGHELVERGHSVLFSKTYALVQRLLAAKRDLRLPQELRRLDHVEALVLDDIGYVQQDRDEMEVLFTLLAERYERRSLLITSNLVFSKWDRIFKDPMTTAAAIDRLVHHSVVVELNVPSYRAEQALARAGKKAQGSKRGISPQEGEAA